MIPRTLARTASLVHKEALETFRDWKMLSMTLSFAPFFVLLMFAYLGHTSPVYQIGVANLDRGATTEEGLSVALGTDLVASLQAITSPEGDNVLLVRHVEGAEADSLLEERRVDLILVIPEGFSETILARRRGEIVEPLPLRSRGDPANPDYLMAAVWTDMTAMTFVDQASGLGSPVFLAPETVSGTTSLSDFDLYVPGLLILSLMMLMFTAAGALIREKDKGTLIRLRLSNLRTLEWLTAVSAVQLLVGLTALGLTYLTAVGVGYRANGSLPILFFIGALTSLSVMAISVLVAAFLRTVFDLVTVGCFPFFILMFFSGGMFPLPAVPLFHWGQRSIELNQLLPTTHAISALNRTLSYGAGLGDIQFEVWAMVVLTIAFFLIGSWIFTRRHLPTIG
jgi:ABC-2 type transport system permease protein